MNVSILLFGITTDLIGASSLDVSCEENSTVGHLKELLLKRYPQLSKIDTYAIAVNEAYSSNETLIYDGDVVAIIPPVSGG